MSEGVSNIYQMGEADPAETEKPLVTVGNKDLRDKVLAALDKINKANQERALANAQKAEVKANLEVDGIPKKSLADFARFIQWDPEVRRQYWQAITVMKEWLDEPVQGDMFEKLYADE